MGEDVAAAEGGYGVVLLAAGASRRMGRPKLLLPWRGGTVLSHLVAQWRDLEARQILVVTPPEPSFLTSNLEPLLSSTTRAVENPDPERGMFSSIQCAAAWEGLDRDLTHWVISLGDQPQVRLETLRRLVAVGLASPGIVVQPGRQGRGRHPVWVPAGLFSDMAASTAAHLKAFLDASGVGRRKVNMEDPGLDLDLDHPEDYEAALKLAGFAGGVRAS